ncbi:hypothetical protein L9F63_010272, partial [Diploptera punctata]
DQRILTMSIVTTVIFSQTPMEGAKDSSSRRQNSSSRRQNNSHATDSTFNLKLIREFGRSSFNNVIGH